MAAEASLMRRGGSRLRALGPRDVLCLGAALRVFLILFSFLQDAYLKVKFTDIDYEVYTDAAGHVLRGGSPYDRDTYRYTPLIAYLLTPNHVLFPAFGKVVFANADIVIAIIQLKLLQGGSGPRPGEESHPPFLVPALALWLFNPYTATISSRGSSDSVSSLCLMLMLLLLERGKILAAGFWFGLATHIRIFPVIYALPLLVHLSDDPLPRSGSGSGSLIFARRWGLQQALRPSRRKLGFSLAAAGTCAGLCLLCYRAEGQRYLDEAILYHFGRFDLAHNFSPWFFIFRNVADDGSRRAMGLAAFLPQVLCIFYFGAVKRSSLPYKLFMITLSFVTLNKVVTAQYFAWYLVLLPLVYPELRVSGALKTAIGLWVAAQVNWLFWAYLYEFEKMEAVLPLVFLSSVAFLLSNMLVILSTDKCYKKFSYLGKVKPRRTQKAKEMEDAIEYLRKVKERFKEKPSVYKKFLDILKRFRQKTIDTQGVVDLVNSLFKGHKDLLLGFNAFVPNGYEIPVTEPKGKGAAAAGDNTDKPKVIRKRN